MEKRRNRKKRKREAETEGGRREGRKKGKRNISKLSCARSLLARLNFRPSCVRGASERLAS